jgi:ferredoxin
MARKPYVDQDVCISCELCVNMVPEVFRMEDSGFAEVYDPMGAAEDKIQEAIDSCPVNCIHWE